MMMNTISISITMVMMMTILMKTILMMIILINIVWMMMMMNMIFMILIMMIMIMVTMTMGKLIWGQYPFIINPSLHHSWLSPAQKQWWWWWWWWRWWWWWWQWWWDSFCIPESSNPLQTVWQHGTKADIGNPGKKPPVLSPSSRYIMAAALMLSSFWRENADQKKYIVDN